jgi:hypothetical protein
MLPNYTFLDRLFTPLNLCLKLTSPLIGLIILGYPIPIKSIIKIIWVITLILYFSGKINIFKSLIISISIIINNFCLNLIDCKSIILNMSDRRVLSIQDLINPDYSVHPPRNANTTEVANKANGAYSSLIQKRPREIARIAESALSRMETSRMIEEPGRGSNHQANFSYEENAAIKFFMCKYVDQVGNGRGLTVLNRYGAWTTENQVQVEGDESLHVFGPLTKSSSFYQTFKYNINVFKANNNI